MALPYRKWTDDDVKNRGISPEGDYQFRVLSSVLKNTKPGRDKNGNEKAINPMLELEFEFHDQNGVIKKQKDWIVFIEGMDWKLRHLASTTDLLDFYESDALEAYHLTNKVGTFTLGIKEYEENGVKKKSNFVKDYVCRGPGTHPRTGPELSGKPFASAADQADHRTRCAAPANTCAAYPGDPESPERHTTRRMGMRQAAAPTHE